MKRDLRIVALVIVVAILIVGLPRLRSVHAQVIEWPPAPYTPLNVNFSGATATLVSAPTSGAVCVYGLQLVNGGVSQDTITIYLDGGTTAVWSVVLQPNGGSANWVLQNGNAKNPYFITNAGQGFVVKSGTAVQINGGIYAATCP